MYRHSFLLRLLAAVLLLCGHQYAPDDGGIPVPDVPLTFLSFNESSSYFKRVQSYECRMEDGAYTAVFWMANEEEPYAVPVDQAWVDTLTGFIHQYDMMDWDGFHGSNAMLLDGTSFSVHFTFADETSVSASGYGDFPRNYGDASRAIDAHFMQLLPEDMRGW